MSFFKFAFGSKASTTPGDTELAEIEEGRPGNESDNLSSLGNTDNHHPIDGGSEDPFITQPSSRILRMPVNDHPLALTLYRPQKPTTPHLMQLAVSPEPSTLPIRTPTKRREPRNHPYGDNSPSTKRGEPRIPFIDLKKNRRELKGRIEAALHSEIKSHKAGEKSGNHLDEQGRQLVAEDMGGIKSTHLLGQLEDAQVSSNTALQEAENEIVRISQMLELATVRAGKAEEEAMRERQAGEISNKQLRSVAEELDQAKRTTAEETQRLAQMLELANDRAKKAEDAAVELASRAKKTFEEQQCRVTFEIEGLRTLLDQNTQEVSRLDGRLKEANERALQAEQAFMVSSEGMKREAQQANKAAEEQVKRMTHLFEQAESRARHAEEVAEERGRKISELLEQAELHPRHVKEAVMAAIEQAKREAQDSRNQALAAERSEIPTQQMTDQEQSQRIGRMAAMEVDGDYDGSDNDIAIGIGEEREQMMGEHSKRKGKGRPTLDVLDNAEYRMSQPEDEQDSVGTVRHRPPQAHNTAEPYGIHNENTPNATRKGARSRESVPPPQVFSRPRTGAHPPLRVDSKRNGDKDVNVPVTHKRANAASSRTGKRGPSYPRTQNRGHMEVDDTEAVEDASDEVDTTPRHNPRRRSYFKKTPLRGFNPERAQKLTAVRVAMNELLGIKKDADVEEIAAATEEDVVAYNEEKLELDLQPMRPYFGSEKTGWNSELCELFLEHFQVQQGVEFNEDQEEEVQDMFDNRIHTLKRKWNDVRRRTDEEAKEEKIRADKIARMNSRRDRKWDDRRQICIEQLEDDTSEGHAGWKATLKVLNDGGPAIVSSDESGWEGNQRVYLIKKRKWRSSEVRKRMQEVDDNQNITNAYGGARAGNAPRRRVRVSDGSESKRAAISGLPENCYSKAWVANLDGRMQKALKMKPRLAFGKI